MWFSGSKSREKKKERIAAWLFVGILPQYVEKYGATKAATLAMGAAMLAVEDLSRNGKLKPLEVIFKEGIMSK